MGMRISMTALLLGIVMGCAGSCAEQQAESDLHGLAEHGEGESLAVSPEMQERISQLKDPRPEVRRKAIASLAGLGPDEAAALLRAADDWELSELEATRAIVHIGPSAIPVCIEGLRARAVHARMYLLPIE